MKERPQPLNTKIYTPKSEEEAGEHINKGRSELSTVAPAAEAFGDKRKMVNRATARHAKLEEITLEVSALSKQEECDCTINRAEDVNLLSDNDFDNDHAHNKELMGGDNPADIHAESIGLMDSLNNNHSESVSLTENIALVAENDSDYIHGENNHAESMGLNDDVNFDNDHMKRMSQTGDYNLGDDHSETAGSMGDDNSANVYADALILDNNYEEGVDLRGNDDFEKDHAENMDFMGDDVPEINHVEHVDLMVDAGINYVMGNAVSPKLSKLPTLAQLPFGVMGIEMAKDLASAVL
ncbi:hypothetical protein BC829DRAFT_420652 [Chytridium lagenaria]|nr:hypothetical protein BC829DRAFT_420652 [Chytridium lagenaria]